MIKCSKSLSTNNEIRPFYFYGLSCKSISLFSRLRFPYRGVSVTDWAY